MATCEHIITHLADEIGVSPEAIRRSNMYKNNEATPFGMTLNEKCSGSWNVPVMWDKLSSSLNISDRREKIDAFNKENALVKRGMALIPTKFGIAFTAKFMNQGGALVHLYTDGTGEQKKEKLNLSAFSPSLLYSNFNTYDISLGEHWRY